MINRLLDALGIRVGPSAMRLAGELGIFPHLHPH